MTAPALLLLALLTEAVPDTVVVCPAPLRQALDPWLAYRARQGHEVALVSETSSPEKIRGAVRQAARGGGLRYVLLVGDAEPDAAVDPLVHARCVPVHRARAQVNIRWGSEPHIGTDNWYADLDDDLVPDVAVGRLTADTPAELATITAKIVAYEGSADFGPWRRKLNVVAGVGGLGPLADATVEAATRFFLTQGIPAGYQVSMTHGNWQSPYCPDPRSFHFTTLRRLNEGCQFWVYVGHGFHTSLDDVRAPDGEHHILANRDIHRLECDRGLPVAVFLACYTGAFDAREDCLAEEMLRTPGAPVAAIAGSRVTMPYAMAVMARELLGEFFQRRSETLGEALLRAKQNMMKPPSPGRLDRAALDAVASLISPRGSELAAERAEHLQLFNLIGDPLLRLRHPRKITLEVPAETVPGATVDVIGTSPVDGRATVELVVRRDRLSFDPPPRYEYPSDASHLAEFQAVYDRANDGRLATVELAIRDGRLHTRLAVPEDAEGRCHVRVFVEGETDYAMGWADVVVGASGDGPSSPQAKRCAPPGQREP